MSTVLELTAVAKTFTMHLQGGISLPVVTGVAFTVRAGECAVLTGRSGAGKSSILKMIFGTYRCDAGSIRVHADGRSVDIAQAEPRQILAHARQPVGSGQPFSRQPTPCLEAILMTSCLRPFLRRRDRVARPQRVAMRARKPCLLTRRLLRGRYDGFIGLPLLQ